MATIKTLIEGKRGCGYKQPGGIYLIAGSIGEPCGKLPIPLLICPCCGSGIKPSRGWTWIDYWNLIKDHPCKIKGCKGCVPFDGSVEKFGLLWIGEKFYKSPEIFTAEIKRMGISRRIKSIPHDFKLGETWILLAHRKTIISKNETFPGIFNAFKPVEMQYVIKGDESEKELDRLEKRGFTIVDIKKDADQINIEQFKPDTIVKK